MRKVTFLVLILAIVGWGFSAPMARADSANGTLFYTTFGGGQNVWSVSYNFNGSTFILGSPTNIASTSGADGILFDPAGNLIVSGQNANSPPQLHEITTGGAVVGNVSAGNSGNNDMGSYHMALSSNASNAILYNMWNGTGTGPTAISATTLSAGKLSTGGIDYSVSAPGGGSTDVRGVIFDPVNSTWYYGTAVDGSITGEFGTVVFNDTTHTATLTRLLTGVAAHGLSFDPFTNTVIMNSGTQVSQFKPGTGIVSTLTVSGAQFDQAAEDGKGHLFVADNNGHLEFVDYDATGLIGAGGNFSSFPFLASTLDDIAPLSGPGSQVPEPSTMLLLGSGLIGLAGLARRKVEK